jgi:DNA adenine methylase
MKYLGGKQRLGRYIAPVLKELWNTNPNFDGYMEPFCGSLGVLQNMTTLDTTTIIANDYHPDLIEMWKKVQNNTLVYPNSINEEQYHNAKNIISPSGIKAFIGFGLSFGGKYFGGYAMKYLNNKKEDFLQEMKNSLDRIRPKIQNVQFNSIDYTTLEPTNLLIYCDPPYKFNKFPIKYRRDTKYYDLFDNDLFWDIMREWSKTNLVVISEMNAPNDFIEIWSKTMNRTASQSQKTRFKDINTAKRKIEKLFIHKSYSNQVYTN